MLKKYTPYIARKNLFFSMKKSHTKHQWYRNHIDSTAHILHSLFMKKQKGFTLIELMVVMAIIAILATAGLSAYTGYIKGARDSKRVTMVRQLQTIVESLTTVSGAPTSQQVTDYLNTEGIAWNIPTETHLLVRAAESVV